MCDLLLVRVVLNAPLSEFLTTVRSIVNPTDGSLPRKPCKTCKNRFHAACLYKVRDHPTDVGELLVLTPHRSGSIRAIHQAAHFAALKS